MSKEKKPRFYISVGTHSLFGTDEYKKRYAFIATARERIQKGVAKGADLPRLHGYGKTELDAVADLHKQIANSTFDAYSVIKMSRAVSKWIKAQSETYTPTQPGICGVDQHNAANKVASESAYICGQCQKDLTAYRGSVHTARNFTDKYFCSYACLCAFVDASPDAEPITPAMPEPTAAKWHTITIAGTEVQRGIVPTQWGDVRVSLGECGEPGGSFEGKECAAFSF